MKLATNNYSQSDIETKLDTGDEIVSVEAKYLSEIIRENQELKRMVGELLVQRRLQEAEYRHC